MNIYKKQYKTILLATLLLFPQASSADTSNEELLDELKAMKERVQILEEKIEKNSEKKSSDSLEEMTADSGSTSKGTSFIRDIASNTTVGGYVSTEFENFEGRDSTFDQHRVILNVSSEVHERVKFYSEIEFEHAPFFGSEGEASGDIAIADTNGNGIIDADEASAVPVSLDTQNGESGELELEQVWAEYEINDNLGLRGGLVLVPFGRYNLYHDDDLWNLTDRPLVARRVIPTTWSDVGVGLTANYEVGDEATLGGEVYVMNGLDDEFSAGSGGLRDARSSRESDNNNNKAIAGRAVFSPMLGQEIGLSGYAGDYDRDGNAITGSAVDWLFTLGDLKFTGEAAQFSIDDGFNSSGARAPKSSEGLFAELDYAFWFAALNDTFLGSSFSDPELHLIGRYNTAEIDRRGGNSILDGDGYALGLAYRPVKSFVLKTEWQFNDGDLERGSSDGFIASIAMGF